MRGLEKLKEWWGFFSFLGKTAVIILLLIIVMGTLAPYLSAFPHDVSSGPPLEPPGGEHFLGTDELGVDLWAMITYGARVSIIVGLGTALLAGLGGGIIGIIAGYKGGWFDKIVMRLVDVMIALPDLPAMIVIAGFFGSSLTNIIIVLSLFSWSRPARIARSQALSLKEQPYLKMASFYGGSTFYLLYKHFVPELFPILSVSMIRLASRAIITEASLAFIGLGDPTSRSWGLILNHALNFSGIYFTPYWKWWLLYPWLALTLLVVALALVGRDLERIADPRMK
ncbi:ABC transporter permease [Natranaerofaba carboxydovora]|uniref:ABC transporter permease n=1 Tax=Natranaerofaba carboxydovora TaxID=2742683 RepID=UPI003B84B155